MVRIVSLLALASFAMACSAPVEDDTATSVDNLIISADSDAHGCALVRAHTRSGLDDMKAIEASELPKAVRPRLGLAKVVGRLAVGDREAYVIEDETEEKTTTRFFREDGMLIARALKKGATITWSGTTGDPLECEVRIATEDENEDGLTPAR